MIASDRLRRTFSPPASVTERDTGLRFTDILFGFVISQIFLRLPNWSELDGFVRWQLIASTALVLGSWIGFRRSVNRTDYEIKFFNLPFVRFLLDQAMVVLYFRVAVLTPLDPKDRPPTADNLVDTTASTLVLIFALYAFWDVLGIAMVWAGRVRPKYGVVVDEKPTDKRRDEDVAGLIITLVFLTSFGALSSYAESGNVSGSGAVTVFAIATALLVAYRWAKEIKNSWKPPSDDDPPAAQPAAPTESA